MTHYEIATKLIGPIQPTGDHGEDMDRRLNNLRATSALVEELLRDIKLASESRSNHQASMRAIGLLAQQILDGFEDLIES